MAESLQTSWLSVPAAEVSVILELGKILMEIVCFASGVQDVPTEVTSKAYVLVLLTDSDGEPVMVT